MKIMILGASGMLGNAMFRVFAADPAHEVFGTVRTGEARRHFGHGIAQGLLNGVDAGNHDSLVRAFATVHPQFVVNCIGLVKQIGGADDPLQAVPINSLLPHRLAALCQAAGARLVHISTDCVFSGSKGDYVETDFADAADLYGRTKLLGELDYPHAITLRTSIIGHELAGSHGLIGWFLAQQGTVRGFRRAVFSGLPTVELSRLIGEVVLPRPHLHGLYHVAARPINKYDLLRLVADVYGKKIDIVPDDNLVIDRSLNADRFMKATGYIAPLWPELITRMHAFR
jgi:dTDP-4-dehydrorhamnose reductase